MKTKPIQNRLEDLANKTVNFLYEKQNKVYSWSYLANCLATGTLISAFAYCHPDAGQYYSNAFNASCGFVTGLGLGMLTGWFFPAGLIDETISELYYKQKEKFEEQKFKERRMTK